MELETFTMTDLKYTRLRLVQRVDLCCNLAGTVYNALSSNTKKKKQRIANVNLVLFAFLQEMYSLFVFTNRLFVDSTEKTDIETFFKSVNKSDVLKSAEESLKIFTKMQNRLAGDSNFMLKGSKLPASHALGEGVIS